MILFARSASWFLVPAFLHRFLFEPDFTFYFFRLNKSNERLSLAKLQPTRTLVVVCYSEHPLDSGRVPGPTPRFLRTSSHVRGLGCFSQIPLAKAHRLKTARRTS